MLGGLEPGGLGDKQLYGLAGPQVPVIPNNGPNSLSATHVWAEKWDDALNDLREQYLQGLPPKLGVRLQRGESVTITETTVVFFDIAGFTSISSDLSASEVTDMLDRLYRRLDELCEKWGLFKARA